MESMKGRASAEVLRKRKDALVERLREGDGFDTALLVSRVNQYWLTGTIQDGIIVIRHDGSLRFFVRRSAERAREESPVDCVIPMSSYRDMLTHLPEDLGRTFVETETMSLAMLDRLRKYLKPVQILPLDRVMGELRAIKDEGELALIEESGKLHRRLMEEIIPSLLREGTNEADLAAEIYAAMVKMGHHGLSRFSMFQMEMVVGQIGFGENSLYPTNFDGPGGMRGLHPAMPILGSRDRRLKKGDLVFVDVGFGYLGYHSDKTQVYSFGAPPEKRAVEAHAACRSVLARALSRIEPGVPASTVYKEAVSDLPSCLSRHFMGYGSAGVKFLGHGVGLQIDEQPVIMASNDAPLEEGMVIALEPKCGVEGLGMVGVEETFRIVSDGPVCLTGGDRDIMVV